MSNVVNQRNRALPWRITTSPVGNAFVVDRQGLPVMGCLMVADDAPAVSLAHDAFDLLAAAPRSHEKTCASRLDEESACDCWQKRRDDLLVLMRGGGRR